MADAQHDMVVEMSVFFCAEMGLLLTGRIKHKYTSDDPISGIAHSHLFCRTNRKEPQKKLFVFMQINMQHNSVRAGRCQCRTIRNEIRVEDLKTTYLSTTHTLLAAKMHL
jgi:hypothetical protein